MSHYYIIIVRVLIVLAYVMSIIKYMNIKQRDKSLKLRFDGYSLAVLIMVALSNGMFFLIPIATMPPFVVLGLGTLLPIVTVLHLRQFMLFSDTIMYYKNSGFLIKDVTNLRLEGNKVHMLIKRQPLSFKRPLSDLAFASERCSGKRPHKR